MLDHSHRSAVRSRRSLGAAVCRFVLAAALGLGALHAHSAPLTLDEALRLAQERSRQLPAQDASAQAARQMATAAGQRPDPILKAGINNLPVNGSDRFSLTNDFMTMRSLGVSQEFTRDGKLKARAARFEREAEVQFANNKFYQAQWKERTPSENTTIWHDSYLVPNCITFFSNRRDFEDL